MSSTSLDNQLLDKTERTRVSVDVNFVINAVLPRWPFKNDFLLETSVESNEAHA